MDAWIKDLMEDLKTTMRKTEFSGVVSLNGPGFDGLIDALGYRNVAEKLQNNSQTRFGIASGTKLFTALGVGRLIEKGALSFDTKVADIDKSYCGFVDPEATIKELLTHTSGIFDYLDEEVIENYENFYVKIPWNKLECPTDYFPLFEFEKKKFNHGERFSYSNGGYVFLGIVIEKIAKIKFVDFMKQEVLGPGKMGRSGFFAFDDLPHNTALGYKKNTTQTNVYNLPIRGGGDGGMYTTCEDLENFWNGLFSFDILSPELTKTFLETKHRFNEKNGYGCGVYKRCDDSIFKIVGVDAGVGFESSHLPQKKITITVFSNVSGGEQAVREVIGNHLP